MPIREMIIKVTECCNLNCNYCGFFLSESKTKNQIMNDQCLEQLLKQIGGYCRDNDSKRILLSWHGGEPLLAGQRFYKKISYYQKKYIPDDVEICNNIQTNLTLLNESWVDLLSSLNFEIRFSLNGPREINDKSRIYTNGKGSYSDVIRGIELLKKKNIDLGCLCVIDPSASGKSVYEHLVSLDIKKMDFLPILGTHDLSTMKTIDNRDFGDFLIEAFDAWFDQGDSSIEIRWFNDVIRKYLGGHAIKCILNTKCSDHLTIGFDGKINTCDCLKICGEKIYYTGYNIYNTPFSKIENSNLYINLHSQKIASPTCKTCEVFNLCSGGCLSWRYSDKKRMVRG